MIRARVQGSRQLKKALASLDKASPRVAAAGVRSGLSEVTKSIRREVPSEYRHLRISIRHRFRRRGRRGEMVAKSGAGVGKRHVPTRKNEHKGGVGIGSANIHWAIMGTAERFTQEGRSTGAMPPILGGVVERGFQKSAPKAAAKIIAKSQKQFEKETAKARRK